MRKNEGFCLLRSNRSGLRETVYIDIVVSQPVHLDKSKVHIHAAIKSKNKGCGCKTVELYSG